jgi:hypothetical protein
MKLPKKKKTKQGEEFTLAQLQGVRVSLKSDKFGEVLEDTATATKMAMRAPTTAQLHRFPQPLFSTSALTITSLNQTMPKSLPALCLVPKKM